MFAQITATPLSRNASFRWKVIKTIEKMKVMFTNHWYLQQVLALLGRMLQFNEFREANPGCRLDLEFAMN